MAQYSVILTVLAVSVLIAHTLCFHIDDAAGQAELYREGRQVADNILVVQNETPPTTRQPLPQRIRDTVLNSIRDLGNNVRLAPTRIQECFQNITRCAQGILRRNGTGTAAAATSNLFQLPQQEQ